MNQPHRYIYPLPSGLPSHEGHHHALGRGPGALQNALISYLFHTNGHNICICVDPNLPIPPTHSLSPPGILIFVLSHVCVPISALQIRSYMHN